MKVVLDKLKTPTCYKQVTAVVEQAEASFYPMRSQRHIKHLWPERLGHCAEWEILEIMQKQELIDMSMDDRELLSSHLWAILVKAQRQPVRLWDRVYSIFEWTRCASTSVDGVVTISKLMAVATID